ncbi:MAG: IPT/TIG domain-containing protein [Nitrospiraceae bacterium]
MRTAGWFAAAGLSGLCALSLPMGMNGSLAHAAKPAAKAAPKMSLSLMPTEGAPGSVVLITGEGMGTFTSAQANRVLFNGVPALVQRWEPTLIEVKVPSGARDGEVVIVRGTKKSTAGSFTVQTPVIERIEPPQTEPGAMITLRGKHFGQTAGPRDPNSMFGVNDVVVGGVVTRARRWRDDSIEVEVPGNARDGSVQVRLGSSDPLPDGSCCADLTRVTSNTMSVLLMPSVRLDPQTGPAGTKVVLFGAGFGDAPGKGDGLTFAGHPAAIAQWKPDVIVAHVPLDAESGPVVLKRGDMSRTVATYTLTVPKAVGVTPAAAPIGTMLKISGENFGIYSESGASAFAFTDFDKGDNGVEIGGVPAPIYRWHNDRIDVWVPFSAKDGSVIVKRGASRPNPDGTCCAEKKILTFDAGKFTVVTPTVTSYSPHSAGLDDVVTITGTGFGEYVKMRDTVKIGLSEAAYKRKMMEWDENISRTEVLINGIAVQVISWKDTEIKVRVPRRHLWGIGKGADFNPDLSKGQIVVRRGGWDTLPDGTCCQPPKYLSIPVGDFTIESKGLPDPSNFGDTRPDANTNQ